MSSTIAVSHQTDGNCHSADKVERLIKLQMLRFARRRRLRSKNGNYIAIGRDGVIQGTTEAGSPSTTLQVLSIGSGMLAIWGMEAARYLAVGLDGTMTTTASEGRHCVFLETVEADYSNVYETYQSVSEGQPRQLAMDEGGKLHLRQAATPRDRDCRFIWELLPCQL